MSDLTTAGATRLATELNSGSFGSGAYLGVGNGTTLFAIAQTDLQGASKERVQVTSSTVSTNTLILTATFGTSQGNFAWNEVGVFNGANPSDTMLVRKVTSILTKTSSMSITLTVNVQFSA